MNNFPTKDHCTDLITQQLTRDIAKFCKNMSGKGPDSLEVKVEGDVVLCIFEGFMTKAEEVILQSGCPDNIFLNRSIYINCSVNQVEDILKKYLNRRIKHLFPCYLPEKNLACWTIILY